MVIIPDIQIADSLFFVFCKKMKRSSSHRSGSSRVLAPHRVLGVVGDGVTPFAMQSLGGEPFVTVSVGHAFQVYSVEHLRVEAVSQRMPNSITALAVLKERTFVACGKVCICPIIIFYCCFFILYILIYVSKYYIMCILLLLLFVICLFLKIKIYI